MDAAEGLPVVPILNIIQSYRKKNIPTKITRVILTQRTNKYGKYCLKEGFIGSSELHGFGTLKRLEISTFESPSRYRVAIPPRVSCEVSMLNSYEVPKIT